MRSADTYRGARRNRCIREEKGVWSAAWYYVGHHRAQQKQSAKKKRMLDRIVDKAAAMVGKINTPQVRVAPKQMRPTGRGQ